jgi:hypothetical protein
MPQHGLLYYYLWIAPHALQVALAVVMLRRKLVREFPAFFLYTLFEVLQFSVLIALSRIDAVSAEQYSALWMAGETISIVLRFAVVREIFSNVFRSYPTLNTFGTLLFRWATAVLVLVAVALVAYTSGNEMDRFTLTITVMGRAVSIVQCGLLVLLLLLSRFLSFTWRSYAFGIALGLGLFASLQLAITAIRAEVGITVATDLFALLSMASYHCCVLFWLVTLLLPEKATSRVMGVPTHNLEHWNDALERLLRQ